MAKILPFCALFLVTLIVIYLWNVSNSINYELEAKEETLLLSDYERSQRGDPSNFSQILQQVKHITGCLDRPMEPKIQQRGDYWVLYNYIVAQKRFKCHESVTITTLGDFTFLDNILPMVERWKGPISVALHAPGTDFNAALDAIKHLRCHSALVREFVTFHIFFPSGHMPPKNLKTYDFEDDHECPETLLLPNSTYKSAHQLVFPINLARNIAREMAQTHFIFPLDIELYPSPYLIPKFLKMIAQNGPWATPRVYPLAVFEIETGQKIPDNKTQVQAMLAKNLAVPFHHNICAQCHDIPKALKWQKTAETPGLRVFYSAKRKGEYVHWEPFYITTHQEPLYDERFTWEGQKDKLVQGFVLCILDYDFMILDNAFLVHKPGIKVKTMDERRQAMTDLTDMSIKTEIMPQLEILFGRRGGCEV
ncbi:beta-1,4-glucuronyltransferase 1 [Tribolium castaneum]|uniref:N-acetyllactosaminide beta-1,3-N-acetylglucosaminyltransferase-like Protein n=1 Tax=Tribolium castaneum TaxID=7070 RepID=D2A3Y4_TRICA|nr:PREDICTED: beta-1,4-glucuronyltransferase 1-like [Tribolium castaneum]EFA05581.1 N-acetyllactosaminide beta-1,3-N-acetylglucosaminyltransferase-like Protein [Tribolium castaneum]|eukprot:XP_015836630.1 PREDICTED: beta-1,4-glucuronyltransferase 1-like [Tribolium castaneum]